MKIGNLFSTRELFSILRNNNKKMARIILLQLATAIVVGVIAALFGGKNAGISSILASLSCVIPNAIFAYSIHIRDTNSSSVNLAGFYFFEIVKVVLTIIFVVAVFWWYPNVNWVSFIISFVIIIKSYIFLLSRSKN